MFPDQYQTRYDHSKDFKLNFLLISEKYILESEVWTSEHFLLTHDYGRQYNIFIDHQLLIKNNRKICTLFFLLIHICFYLFTI